MNKPHTICEKCGQPLKDKRLRICRACDFSIFKENMHMEEKGELRRKRI